LAAASSATVTDWVTVTSSSTPSAPMMMLASSSPWVSIDRLMSRVKELSSVMPLSRASPIAA
jgi:hypothetical protein